MSGGAANLHSVAEAQRQVLEGLTAVGAETVTLGDALGRVLRETIMSRLTVPGHDNSAMDGYAVRSQDCAVIPCRLPVVGATAAGALAAGEVAAGAARLIMTGAPLPAGADCVVAREQTDDGRQTVEIRVAPVAGQHVRRAGEDMAPGAVAVEAGARLGPAQLAAAAAAGWDRLSVSRRPVVGLLSTGDELVQPGMPVGPTQVVDSNGVALAAAIVGAGATVRSLGTATDTPEAVRAALERAAGCDLIVSSAGVSVGDHDHVRDVVTAMGALELWRVALRPGKPLALGRVGTVPFIGLPGNPVSSQVTFELFARPAILGIQGAVRPLRAFWLARLGEPVEAPAGLETYLRGRLVDGGDGPTVVLSGGQGSGMTASMARADCLIRLPAAVTRCEAGDLVEVLALS